MKEPPTRKTKQSSTTHVTPLQGDAQSTHGEFRPTFYNPFEIKHRQRVTRSQLKVLEKAFAENPLPPGSTRQQLSIRLSMTPRTIQIWFQNRRAKSKQISTQTSGHGVDQNVADSQTPMPTNTGTTSVFESSSSAEPQGVQPGDAVDPFDFDDAQSSIVPSQQHSFHVDGSEPLDQNILVSAQASIADKNDILDNGKNDLSLSNVYVSDLSTEVTSLEIQSENTGNGDILSAANTWNPSESWSRSIAVNTQLPEHNSLSAIPLSESKSEQQESATGSISQKSSLWPVGIVSHKNGAIDFDASKDYRSISFQLPETDLQGLSQNQRPSTLHLLRRMSMPASLGSSTMLDMKDTPTFLDVPTDTQRGPHLYQNLHIRDPVISQPQQSNLIRTQPLDIPQSISGQGNSQDDTAVYHLQQQLQKQLHVQHAPERVQGDFGQHVSCSSVQQQQQQQHASFQGTVQIHPYSFQETFEKRDTAKQNMSSISHFLPQNGPTSVQEFAGSAADLTTDACHTAPSADAGFRYSLPETYHLPQLQTPRMLAQLQNQLGHQSWRRMRTFHGLNAPRSRHSLPVNFTHNNARRYSEPGTFLAALENSSSILNSGTPPGSMENTGSLLLATGSGSFPPQSTQTCQSPQHEYNPSQMDYTNDTLTKMRNLNTMFPKSTPPQEMSHHIMSLYPPPSLQTSPSSVSMQLDTTMIPPTAPSSMSSSPTFTFSPSSSMSTSPVSDRGNSHTYVFTSYSPNSANQNNMPPFEATRASLPSPANAQSSFGNPPEHGPLEGAPGLVRGFSLDSLTWNPPDQSKSQVASLVPPISSRRHSQTVLSPTSPHPLQQEYLQQQYQLQQHQLHIQQSQYQQFVQQEQQQQYQLVRGNLPASQLFSPPPPAATTHGTTSFPLENVQTTLRIHPLDQEKLQTQWHSSTSNATVQQQAIQQRDFSSVSIPFNGHVPTAMMLDNNQALVSVAKRAEYMIERQIAPAAENHCISQAQQQATFQQQQPPPAIRIAPTQLPVQSLPQPLFQIQLQLQQQQQQHPQEFVPKPMQEVQHGALSSSTSLQSIPTTDFTGSRPNSQTQSRQPVTPFSTLQQRMQPSKQRLHRSQSLSVASSVSGVMPYAEDHQAILREIVEAYKHEAFVREHQRQQRESEQSQRL